MKRNNKKGFTIVELVIVIAVIAILSAVLIPTFGGITDKANKSAAEQAARNGHTKYYALDLADGKLDGFDGDPTVEANKITATETGATYTVASDVATYTITTNGYQASFNGSTMTSNKVNP